MSPQLEFFGDLPWTILLRCTLPLAIFHRFHSTVVLAAIWKNSYKTRIEWGLPGRPPPTTTVHSISSCFIHTNGVARGVPENPPPELEPMLHTPTSPPPALDQRSEHKVSLFSIIWTVSVSVNGPARCYLEYLLMIGYSKYFIKQGLHTQHILKLFYIKMCHFQWKITKSTSSNDAMDKVLFLNIVLGVTHEQFPAFQWRKFQCFHVMIDILDLQ